MRGNRLVVLTLLGWLAAWGSLGPGLAGVAEAAGPERAVPAGVAFPLAPWSDLVTGTIVEWRPLGRVLCLRTHDGTIVSGQLTTEGTAVPLRNLGEPAPRKVVPAGRELVPGRLAAAFGTFYPEAAGPVFEIQKVFLLERPTGGFRFEEPGWYVDQVRHLGDTYLRWQFPDGVVDFDRFSTNLSFEGRQKEPRVQEAAVLSRMIYGWASAFLMTGEDRFLEAARLGCEHLRREFRRADPGGRGIYWDHARVWVDGPLAVRETGVPRRHPWRQGGTSDLVSVGPFAVRETGVSRRHPWRQRGTSDIVSVGPPAMSETGASGDHPRRPQASSDLEPVGHWERVTASRFADDRGGIPLYEQIYVLAGLTQTFRATGDPVLLEEIRATQAFFEARFRDPVAGGYWSHLDPETLRPDAVTLGKNRSRKNWNSVGDHAPAYLINLFLARRDPADGERLRELGGLICHHFPGDVRPGRVAAPGVSGGAASRPGADRVFRTALRGREGAWPAFRRSAGAASAMDMAARRGEPATPFVQERFLADWTPDRTWFWQRDRAVVGHDLKIAWNLQRLAAAFPDPEFLRVARELLAAMPLVGLDRQRGGWYDVVERRRPEGRRFHPFVWHDRKVWWQQEQGILAFALQAGRDGDPAALALARLSAAFYNNCFLDQYDGGVYFHVTAQGQPFALGDERIKGGHAMAGYHAFELCFLAHLYTQLLIAGGAVDLFFRPVAGAAPLYAMPDLLPTDRLRLAGVEIDGQPVTLAPGAGPDLDVGALAPRGGRVKVRWQGRKNE